MKTISTMPLMADYSLRAVSLAPPGNVDRDKRLVRGVAVLQSGNVNDSRKLSIDATTLSQVVTIGNGGTKNLKARWTHPNLSGDGLGKYLGRWKNFRMSDDGQTVLADLQLAPIAFRQVDSELGMSRGEWVLEMAENDHDAFGVSLAPAKMDTKAMEDGEDEEGYQPYRVLSLTAIDVVDDPAATRGGLFGGLALSVEAAPRFATEALDKLFPEAEPEVIRARVEGFLNKYLARRSGDLVNSLGANHMATETKPEGITQESLDKFGETLLGKVDEKLAAIAAKNGEAEASELSKEQLLESERTRCKELFALAANAGLDAAKADEWINKNLSVLEAKGVVADLAIARNGLSNDAGENDADPDMKYRLEYRAALSVYQAEGVTEDQYVESAKQTEKQSAF